MQAKPTKRLYHPHISPAGCPCNIPLCKQAHVLYNSMSCPQVFLQTPLTTDRKEKTDSMRTKHADDVKRLPSQVKRHGLMRYPEKISFVDFI